MRIVIETIPHEEQLYETCGNWAFEPNGDMIISVSDLGNEDYEFMLGIHEAVEAYLCRKRGITDEEVTAFDKANIEDHDPGEIFQAPYHKEHMTATIMERILANELGVDWRTYDEELEGLFE